MLSCRLDKYLTSSELEESAVERADECYGTGIAIEVKNGTFSWDEDSDDPAVLKAIDVEIKRGSLAAVVGTVGSGKSSFLCSLLGEMHKITGKVWHILNFFVAHTIFFCGKFKYLAHVSNYCKVNANKRSKISSEKETQILVNLNQGTCMQSTPIVFLFF
jgi:energy-coupling factor transporter ATP-binding protein EcfA2